MAVTTTTDARWNISSGTAAEVLAVIKALPEKRVVGFHYDGTVYHVLYIGV